MGRRLSPFAGSSPLWSRSLGCELVYFSSNPEITRVLYRLTWLERAPKIKLLPMKDQRSPYPLTRDEQSLFFQELPDHLARMALFKVNTGCREQEVCALRWDWEVQVPELDTSVFIVPGERVKNEEERLVVLNRVARSVIDSVRGMHPEFVFVYAPKPREGEPTPEPQPLTGMNNTAWKSARERAATSGKQTDSKHRSDFVVFASMISSTRSVDACVRPASPSRIVRTCSVTRVRASQRTTLRRS